MVQPTHVIPRLVRRMDHRPALHGAAALFVLLALIYSTSIDIRATQGASITADEPFYLMTTESLLRDGNLDLRNQFRTRAYEAFFDHPLGLWTQSVPLEDGRVLSPHNVGLSVLLLPGFAIDGLVGAQVQLVLMAALTWALAYVLALRLTGARPWLVWGATVLVALSATGYIYSSEIYPEIPAGLALVVTLLLVTGPERPSPTRVLALVALLSTLPWLGAKYAPLAAYVLWRADTQGRALLLAGGGLSALAYAAFHLATYESLTPYNVNLVYAGDTAAGALARHLDFGDRVYRLWGLLIDRRFGVARWAPVLFLVLPGLLLLARGDGRMRLVLGLIVTQVLIATFVAITMMGWWFSGRTLVTVFPLLPIPLVLIASRGAVAWRVALAVLGAYSLAVTAALALAGRSREVVIAVDPWEMEARLFRVFDGVFPQYTAWTTETWVLTAAWLTAGAVALVAWVTLGEADESSAPTPPGDPDQSDASASSPSAVSVSR
ncbi:MAG: hypothetical protein OXH97_00575 [Chloroflexota bacterium]|nr:hypothetical protein [Chloroflexota bacterium]